jgi:ABC-type multidrug transport system permease subunit
MFLSYVSPNSIEELLVTRTGLREYIIAASSFSTLTTLASAIFSFVAAILLFGIQYSYNIPLLSAIVLLGVVTSVGMGFLGLAFNLVYKQTAVLSWFIYTLTGLVGNMLVPVQVLPVAIQALSLVTPQYYFFTGIRVALGSQVSSATNILGVFTVYALILLLLGIVALNGALRSVRRTGTHRWT